MHMHTKCEQMGVNCVCACGRGQNTFDFSSLSATMANLYFTLWRDPNNIPDKMTGHILLHYQTHLLVMKEDRLSCKYNILPDDFLGE